MGVWLQSSWLWDHAMLIFKMVFRKQNSCFFQCVCFFPPSLIPFAKTSDSNSTIYFERPERSYMYIHKSICIKSMLIFMLLRSKILIFMKKRGGDLLNSLMKSNTIPLLLWQKLLTLYSSANVITSPPLPSFW